MLDYLHQIKYLFMPDHLHQIKYLFMPDHIHQIKYLFMSDHLHQIKYAANNVAILQVARLYDCLANYFGRGWGGGGGGGGIMTYLITKT